MKKNWRIALAVIVLALIVLGWFLSRPDVARFTTEQLSGRVPAEAALDAPRPETIPTVNIAEISGWDDGATPIAAAGLAVNAFADGLDHPRSMLVLPNGDVLVAETNKPAAPTSGITGWIMERLMAKAGAGVPSANRITLLRDVDGDGRADLKVAYLEGLNSPFGMALVGDTLFVANTDAIMAYPYVEDETRITAKGRKVAPLPAQSPNYHWTKNMVASADGKFLYVAVGSNSNAGENGVEKEKCVWKKGFPPEFCRAAILEIDVATGAWRPWATGLRNPVGLAWLPGTDSLWVVVNERDQLGSDLVPDYLTDVTEGDFFGWPWYYWGGYFDKRISDEAPSDLRQYTKRPAYALGSHVAPLGLTFAQGAKLGDKWTNGAFIALHGSWNREPAAGYKVVFVKFGAAGKPAEALPVDVLTGFLADNGDSAHGRPTGVTIAKDGSLLVTDDVSNVIWRVSAAAAK
ncbi:MAG: sorbosone dehydrogenase family protein [Sphingomonadales bacterium]|nr:sorbosone dehydrogenase family protein [Sphingomonadales bacterium]